MKNTDEHVAEQNEKPSDISIQTDIYESIKMLFEKTNKILEWLNKKAWLLGAIGTMISLASMKKYLIEEVIPTNIVSIANSWMIPIISIGICSLVILFLMLYFVPIILLSPLIPGESNKMFENFFQFAPNKDKLSKHSKPNKLFKWIICIGECFVKIILLEAMSISLILTSVFVFYLDYSQYFLLLGTAAGTVIALLLIFLWYKNTYKNIIYAIVCLCFLRMV